MGSLGLQVQSSGMEASLGEIAGVCTDWTLMVVVVDSVWSIVEGDGLVTEIGAEEIDWTTRSRMTMLETMFYKIASALEEDCQLV